MNNQISGLRYLILNLVFIHHRKGKLNGKKIKNNFKKPCDWQSETSFFFLILPKPQNPVEKERKTSQFQKVALHSSKLEMSKGDTYCNKNKTKNKNHRGKKGISEIGKNAGPSRHRERHCHQVVTVPQVTLCHLDQRSQLGQQQNPVCACVHVRVLKEFIPRPHPHPTDSARQNAEGQVQPVF